MTQTKTDRRNRCRILVAISASLLVLVVVLLALRFLRDDQQCNFETLIDICGVDYPERGERFEVVYILYSFSRNSRIRVKTRIKDGERLPSVVPVHLTADWLEREVFEQLGEPVEGRLDKLHAVCELPQPLTRTGEGLRVTVESEKPEARSGFEKGSRMPAKTNRGVHQEAGSCR